MQHSIRPVSSLNGLWDFTFLGPIELDSFSPAGLTRMEKLPVPSAFDALPGHAGKRGAAVYRTHLQIPAGHPAKLEFGAVSMWSRLFIDGVRCHEQACGYAPFVVEVPAAATANRELVVLVDNRFDFERVPMHEEYFDFYQYGGILREVTLHVLPTGAPFIDHLHVRPMEDYRAGAVQVVIELGGRVPSSITLTTQFDDATTVSHQRLPVHNARIVLSLKVPAPQVWAPDSPRLHTLRVILGDQRPATAWDDAAVRFGLRRIEARAGALWLNGQKLQLRGYNRHEWHPNYGPCTPQLQLYADLQLLRGLGCNFVRGSHYPQDQRFLDLCDQLGFLVWEENLGWGQREKTFADEKFQRDHEASLRAMVRASANHPSVIIWGFLNEAGTDSEYVRPIFERTAGLLRELDPTRLVSYASMFALSDRHFDLADLIALNLYPGWYGCEGVENPIGLIAPLVEKCLAHLDAAGFREKPVIISEIGAEGLYGWRDAHHDFFTEEFQADYLREACRAALSHPRCSGIALWHFSDVRTYGGGWSLKRPRTFNNKGTLDEFRRPKAAYAAVRAVFTAAAGLK
jgi:beta-glucuronidase